MPVGPKLFNVAVPLSFYIKIGRIFGVSSFLFEYLFGRKLRIKIAASEYEK